MYNGIRRGATSGDVAVGSELPEIGMDDFSSSSSSFWSFFKRLRRSDFREESECRRLILDGLSNDLLTTLS